MLLETLKMNRKIIKNNLLFLKIIYLYLYCNQITGVKTQLKLNIMNVNQMLLNDQENGNLILNLGIAQKSNGDLSTYGDVCGSWYEGVHQWASHNIYSLDEVENQKYRGYIVTDSMGEESRFVIPQWVLKKDIGKDWKYAKNIFCKFLRRI